MCGRLSQYTGIHDFVAVLAMWPGAFVATLGDQPLERYNAGPSQQLALLHQKNDTFHADLMRWGWRPY